ncbi:hypothetical protein M409DRAFT_57771 [Zasmidium cellare ATCC 36951]|uniref:Uncharacterized protein n=1 Tax=Zasmidium cellare ATCC 36951 TaxID=1080233 RepID=A0A6A6CA37_ZASCE|nr:uncharacterized protein M409DRAFT_57771 [Zasmidium cellare ATCC 36951]KAF2163098.1 hypothetical protein M409DRAFT_57771 [Zasmidium cellare ATCC 36951]
MTPPTSHDPANGFLQLPPDIRDMACQMAARLEHQMDVIVSSGRLRATNIIPIGKEILDLSSLCCCIQRMLAGEVPCSIPSHEDLDEHVMTCIDQNCCGCCSVLALMDLEGDVLRSFSDDDDDGVMPVETQNAALRIVVQEVEKAVAALNALFPEEGKPFPDIERRGSLESPNNRQLSQRLGGLFGRARRKSARSPRKAKSGDVARMQLSGTWQDLPCYEEL